ncbi:TetR/AcrR family transcriptional regulator [Agromyces aerolatus]|uniref:TetR/AcrR family transcriptional regulator n=1 Tax=Agromyces sp. LY-1074 TaxID=3074080 RepID=UPI0028606AF3|nr:MULTISPECIES: TetR/AcrR family transcriptional regulator [unclassified Agromyces]MDR5699079.1 TetR/AcrR family transcriptional regulator [Agromyces sp. LY-1074]MDR5705143.1 TetR/AcrR family transcriptional regulator [Agromyces sp. LY-1358]
MSRPPAAREAVLDAFEHLIVADGERTATLDATARHAGVSKGGLLYHFGSRQALIAGLIERLHRLIREDVERIDAAPDGAISYFIRSSTEVATPLDRTFVAVVRLAQGGDRDAAEALEAVRRCWLDALSAHVGDPTVALAVTLIGDGLYYHAALSAESADSPAEITTIDDDAMYRLVALLERLARSSPASPDGTAAGEASGT